MKTLIKNCAVSSPGFDWKNGWILMEDGMISDIGRGGTDIVSDKVIDAANLTAAPGFIDIHCHGRSNADFCDATEEAFQTIARGKAGDGVTSFLATTLSIAREDLLNVFRVAADYRNNGCPELLGMHVEGPFFNPECAGAQNPAFLLAPDIEMVKELNAVFPILKLSFSPELDGGLDFCRELCEMGVMPSGAHSNADFEIFKQAHAAGMKHLTHFCNVMTPVHHLRFGMVGGGLITDDVYVEIICDGVHLCDEMIYLITKMKGPERIMLITDAMMASGMPDGKYSLGGLAVNVCDGKAVTDGGAVAGSTLKYYDGLKRLFRISGWPLSECLRATSLNQAESLHIKNRGRLEKGWIADIVLLDEHLKPAATIARGEIIWQ